MTELTRAAKINALIADTEVKRIVNSVSGNESAVLALTEKQCGESWKKIKKLQKLLKE